MDKTKCDNIIVSVTEREAPYNLRQNDTHFLTSGEVTATLLHGATVEITVNFVEEPHPEVDGIYYGEQKISQVHNGSHVITVPSDATVEIRFVEE